jgi:hypothetical protein
MLLELASVLVEDLDIDIGDGKDQLDTVLLDDIEHELEVGPALCPG